MCCMRGRGAARMCCALRIPWLEGGSASFHGDRVRWQGSAHACTHRRHACAWLLSSKTLDTRHSNFVTQMQWLVTIRRWGGGTKCWGAQCGDQWHRSGPLQKLPEPSGPRPLYHACMPRARSSPQGYPPNEHPFWRLVLLLLPAMHAQQQRAECCVAGSPLAALMVGPDHCGPLSNCVACVVQAGE
jgi:hypothetical protein